METLIVVAIVLVVCVSALAFYSHKPAVKFETRHALIQKEQLRNHGG